MYIFIYVYMYIDKLKKEFGKLDFH
jgi:hypothetical protein